MKRFLTVFLYLFALRLSGAWPRDPSLAQLQDGIAKRGIAKVADELNHQVAPDPWDSIEAHVESGVTAWLDLARQLRFYTDAGASVGLENAVALALPKNPVAVLKILGTDPAKDFTVRRVCSIETFIEVPEGKLRSHLRRAKAAVDQVSDPHLQQTRQACLEVLNRSMNPKVGQRK